MELAFHTLDVFTDHVFGGNPLAVFPDGRGLGDAVMQRIAREMNLSETVFLFPPETDEGTRRVRIFTPGAEVPFAGHPTVGTAFFLAATGEVGLEGERTRIVLEEKVGPVPVEIRSENGRPVSTKLTAAVAPEYRDATFPDDQLASLLSLPHGAVGAEGLSAEFVSCGLPFLVVPVRDLEAARRSRLDPATWETLLADAWSRKVYVVCLEPEGAGVDVHVRMYAPGVGVPEDPATGSAAAALAGYLGKRAGVSEGSLRWRVEQGIEMGRPSLLEVEAELEGGRVVRAHVGGRSVMVSRGTMRVPDEVARA